MGSLLTVNERFQTFIEEIERYVQDFDVSYIDAVVHICESKGIDIESFAMQAKKDKTLMEKIEAEAIDLNLLPQVGRLPL